MHKIKKQLFTDKQNRSSYKDLASPTQPAHKVLRTTPNVPIFVETPGSIIGPKQNTDKVFNLL